MAAKQIEIGGVAADRLRSLVERLEPERKALGSDFRDIYAEAKSAVCKSSRSPALSQ